jgi:hypothetical protein
MFQWYDPFLKVMLLSALQAVSAAVFPIDFVHLRTHIATAVSRVGCANNVGVLVLSLQLDRRVLSSTGEHRLSDVVSE